MQCADQVLDPVLGRQAREDLDDELPATRRCTNRRAAEQLATSPGSSIFCVGIVIALTPPSDYPSEPMDRYATHATWHITTAMPVSPRL